MSYISIIVFIVICILFILSAISYSILVRNLKSTDITNAKTNDYNTVKGISLTILIISGAAVLLQGYMILFNSDTDKVETPSKFEGTEKCSDECNGTENITISK
jgi:multisubunit Na+/H+ antiporter MnhB subunit